MRILHIANFSIFKNDAVFYSTDKKISNGLIRNGHLVSDFSYRDISKINRVLGLKKIGINKMIKSLIISIDNLQPELILLGHSELINGEVLSFIREKYPKIKIAMWWVDWLKNLSSIKSKILVFASNLIPSVEGIVALYVGGVEPLFVTGVIVSVVAFPSKSYFTKVSFVGEFNFHSFPAWSIILLVDWKVNVPPFVAVEDGYIIISNPVIPASL